MADFIKNISIAEPMQLKSQLPYQQGEILNKVVVKNAGVSIILFSFAKGEELTSRGSQGDALVLCVDGTERVTIDQQEMILHEGESVVIPARHAYSFYGQDDFKMLLTLVLE